MTPAAATLLLTLNERGIGFQLVGRMKRRGERERWARLETEESVKGSASLGLSLPLSLSLPWENLVHFEAASGKSSSAF